jgi:hypothetical protein
MKNRFENEAPKKKASRLHFLSISVDLDPFSGGQNRRKRVPERDPKKSVFSVAEKTEKSEKSSQTPNNLKTEDLARPTFRWTGGRCPAGGG